MRTRSFSGQSFTIVIYDSRVVPDLKIPYITTLDVNYERKLFIRLATVGETANEFDFY